MQTGRFLRGGVFALLVVAGFTPAAFAQQTFVVNSFDDDVDDDTGDGLCSSPGGVCTLRAAIQQANVLSGPDQILVPVAGTYTLTLPGDMEDAGATGDLDITDDVVISGLSPTDTIVDADGLDRIFHILGGTVQIQSMTIRGGAAPLGEIGGGLLTVNATTTVADVVVSGNHTAGFFEGGGIANDGGSVFVYRSSLINNTADCGAGLFNVGVIAVLENVTASGNMAFCTGGGLLDGGVGDTFVTNSTFVANTPNNIAGTQDTLHLSNTWLVPAFAQDNCDILSGSGTIDAGGNFAATVACDAIPITPNADLVQNLTLDSASGQYVHRPLVPNPVIDGGDPAVCSSLLAPLDQRGVARPQGAVCDSGAVELRPLGIVSGAPGGATWNTAYVHNLSSSGEGAIGFTVSAGTLPAGLLLSTVGVISGTPTGLGLSSFTIRLTDESGQTLDQAAGITVSGTAVSVSGVPTAAAWNLAYTFAFTSTGNGTRRYAVTAGALPTGLLLTSAGTIIGTPTTVGLSSFTVTVVDDTAQTSSLARSITVTGTAASISGTPAAATLNGAYSFAFTGAGNGTLIYALTAGALPSGLVLTSAGAIIGTPTASGLSSFTVTVIDATAQASSLATSITVTAGGAPTVTGVTNVTIEENRAIPPMTLTVGDDVTSPDQLTVSAVAGGDTILSAVSLTGSGTTRTLQLTLAEDREGHALVTVTVSDGTLSSTATASITATSAPIPDAPTDLMAVPDGNAVVFSWRAPVAGAVPTFYVLEGGSQSGRVTVPIVNTGRTTSFRTVVPAGTWYYRVRSGNSAGISTPSSEISGTIGAAVTNPGAPQGAVASVDGMLARLAWHAPVAGGPVSAWQVEVGSAPGLSDLAVLRVPANTLAIQGTLNPGRYAVRVRSVGAAGDGPASNEAIFTVGAVEPCGLEVADPPVLLPATVGNRLVTLTWRPPTNRAVRNYRIIVGSAPGLGDIGAADVGPVTSFAAVAGPGQYYVTVLAVNDCGSSLPSNPILVVVP